MIIKKYDLNGIIETEEECFRNRYSSFSFEDKEFEQEFKDHMAMAERFHDGQMRYTEFEKIPYIVHPFKVALMIYAATQNKDLTIAALYHDVVEDTDFRLYDIFKLTNEQVATYVMEVTKESAFNSKKFDQLSRAEKNDIECKKLAKISSFGKSLKLADIIANSYSIKHTKSASRWFNEKFFQLSCLKDSETPELYDIAKNLIKFEMSKS